MLRPITVVTGASSGIGRELVLEAARRGRDTVGIARRADRLAEVKQLVDDLGTRFIPLALDLRDPNTPALVRDAVHAQGYTVNLLVNNAGFGTAGRTPDTDGTLELDMLRVNIEAVLGMTRVFLPDLAATHGALVNVASTAAFQPTPYMAMYGATKAFVLSYSEALSVELKSQGIRVTAFCPGPIPTEFSGTAGTKSSEVPGFVVISLQRAVTELLDEMARFPVQVPGFWNKVNAVVHRFVPGFVMRKMSAAYLAGPAGVED